MAATYVQIDRSDLEDWLRGLSKESPFNGKMTIKSGTVGVYLLHLSDAVAVRVSSTIGRMDTARGRGKASTKLSLVSLVTGHTLNKKAQGQSRFHRTTNWRTNWSDGVKRFTQVYLKSQGWYEALARIENRDAYRLETLGAIEARPNWESDKILSEFHGKVEKGGILTVKQQGLLDRLLGKPQPEKVDPKAKPLGDPDLEAKLERLRDLWKAANRAGDEWTKGFCKSIADRYKRGMEPSDKQQPILTDKFRRYRVGSRVSPGAPLPGSQRVARRYLRRRVQAAAG